MKSSIYARAFIYPIDGGEDGMLLLEIGNHQSRGQSMRPDLLKSMAMTGVRWAIALTTIVTLSLVIAMMMTCRVLAQGADNLQAYANALKAIQGRAIETEEFEEAWARRDEDGLIGDVAKAKIFQWSTICRMNGGRILQPKEKPPTCNGMEEQEECEVCLNASIASSILPRESETEETEETEKTEEVEDAPQSFSSQSFSSQSSGSVSPVAGKGKLACSCGSARMKVDELTSCTYSGPEDTQWNIAGVGEYNGNPRSRTISVSSDTPGELQAYWWPGEICGSIDVSGKNWWQRIPGWIKGSAVAGLLTFFSWSR